MVAHGFGKHRPRLRKRGLPTVQEVTFLSGGCRVSQLLRRLAVVQTFQDLTGRFMNAGEARVVRRPFTSPLGLPGDDCHSSSFFRRRTVGAGCWGVSLEPSTHLRKLLRATREMETFAVPKHVPSGLLRRGRRGLYPRRGFRGPLVSVGASCEVRSGPVEPVGRLSHLCRSRSMLSREGVVERAVKTRCGDPSLVGVFSFAGAGIGENPAFGWDRPPYRISGDFKERSELSRKTTRTRSSFPFPTRSLAG